MPYTELQVTTNFSFLRGASHPEEMIEHAAALGYKEIAVTDRNTFAGIVRAHVQAKKSNIKLIVGCHIQLQDGAPLLAYPTNKNGYSNICALLTLGNMRTTKGLCDLYKKDAYEYLKDVMLIALAPQELDNKFELPLSFKQDIAVYKKNFTVPLYLGMQRRYHGNDSKFLFQLQELAQQHNIPIVATNDVFYHNMERRQLQDVVTCIREKCTIQNAGLALYPNAERYLKPSVEMERLFVLYPTALAHTQEIAAACKFSLDELKYEYPKEITSNNRTPQEELTYLTWQGAKEFYGDDIPQVVINNIQHELRFIDSMNYAAYFLTVHDIVRFAREREILCQGRGSAANSTVCFCLGITAVNPAKFDLLFERFLSAARNEPPDIDVDFEHERREEVIQYIYQKYGRERAAIVATVTQQQQRGAIRDVGKAMGLSVDMIAKLSSSIMRMSKEWFTVEKLAELGVNVSDSYLRKIIELTHEFIGFPRQLGQHTGGFVISENPLSQLCPTLNARMENRSNLEWNKDDIEALGFLKIDVLALGMLTCIRKAFVLVEQHYGRHCTLANVPQDDPKVYDMISDADTIGVFQIESRAQQSMLPRLQPRCFYDLVIEVAIVRPGPIQGDMVHPYLRRRNGLEPVTYPSKALEDILKRTLGVPLFQEQAMKIAIVAAGFTPTEADNLRRSMATFKAKGKVSEHEEKLIAGMLKNGYTLEFAKRIFKQLEGFGSYGFPESHAASFALLVYISSWLKCYYPDAFACALLNSLPMGFYQPAQIIIDAQKHGVKVLPADVNYSQWDHLLAEKDGNYQALRLGFRQIKGIKEQDAQSLIAARTAAFTHIQQLFNIDLSDAALQLLANADAFSSLGLNRREALWQISVRDKPKALFANQIQEQPHEQNIELPFMSQAEHVVHDYSTTSLSLKAHPLSFLREKLSLLKAITHDDLAKCKNGQQVCIAGLVLVRQKPSTAKGVMFITLEDETNVSNLVVFAPIFEKYRKEIIQARLLMVKGKVQIEQKVIHVLVSHCYNITSMLGSLNNNLSRADELSAPKQGSEFTMPRNFR